MTDKKWVKIFYLSERAWLEEELNEFIKVYDPVEITMWNDNGKWCAMCRYSAPEAPAYFKRKEC